MSHNWLMPGRTLFLFCTLLSGANASAGNDLQALTITDWHIHVAGLGYGDSNNFINQQMRDNFRFRFFLKWMDVSLEELTEQGDQLVVKRLNEKIEQSQYIELTERRLRRMCRFPDNYYRIVFKFDSMRHYLAWKNSCIGKK